VNVIEFISDPTVLGPYFDGPSWDRWRAVLKAAYALPMTPADLARFSEVAGNRAPPSRPVRELVACVGRGGGKDSVASALATYIAASSDFSRLRPGEKGTVLCLAVDRSQAGIAHDYIGGVFRAVPRLAAMVASQDDDTITLKNGAEIVVGTNSLRSVRGRTYACAIYDECAFWYSDEYANPAAEVDAAVSPGLMRFPGSLKILISSVHRRSGLLYDRYATHFGKDSDDVLVVLGASLDFNETLDRAEIERHLAEDPDKARAEYLSRWRDDLSNFLDRELVEGATDYGVPARPCQPGINYVSFTDPSGGRGDSFCCAIAHADGNTVIIDALYERRAPFDPSTAFADVAALHRQYGISETTGDNYAAGLTVEGFAKVGLIYRLSERSKSQIFLDSLPLFTGGRIRLVDDARLRNQLISLERRTFPSGRDTVAHPDYRNAHDDAANAACGAATLAASEAAPAIFHPKDLLGADNAPIPWAFRCETVFATVAVDASGPLVAFWAAAGRYAYQLPRTILIDYERPRLTPSFWADVAARLQQLRAATYVGQIGLALVQPELQASAMAAGFEFHTRAPAAVLDTATRPEALILAGTQVGMGQVKISSLAAERARSLPNPIDAIRPDAPPSAPSDAVLLGIAGNLPREVPLAAWRGKV
jgi:hypothetical protein